MAIPSPAWVTFDAEEPTGLDLLGLRAPVQAIGNELMDGLTTVTPKPRYLSVLSWAIARYLVSGLPKRWQEFRQFVAAQEAALVMANVVRERSTQRLVGVQEARDRVDSGARTLSLEPLVQQIALNIYASSGEQLGLTFSDGGVFGLSRERGERLAKAFDKGVLETQYAKRLARKKSVDQISRGEIKELAEHFSLDELPVREANILIDALLPLQPRLETSEPRRLATFATLLWLANEISAIPTEETLFEAAHNPPAGAPAILRRTLNGWLVYAVRDLLAVAHEAVFEATMSEVDAAMAERGAPAPAAEVISRMLGAIDDFDEQLRVLHLLSKAESVRDISFETVAQRVQKRCRQNASFEGGLRRWNGGISEYDLGNSALEAGAAAAALLPIAWCLAEWRITVSDGDGPPPRQLLSIGAIHQIGIRDVMLPKLTEYRRSNMSYLEVMADLIVRTAQQHLRVAWQRFATPNGKNVSVLVADVENWSRKNPFAAGRTDSRLGVATSWLEQLGLVNEHGVTDRGKQILGRSLAALERSSQ